MPHLLNGLKDSPRFLMSHELLLEAFGTCKVCDKWIIHFYIISYFLFRAKTILWTKWDKYHMKEGPKGQTAQIANVRY